MKTLKNTTYLDEPVTTCQWTGGAQIDEMEDLQRLIVDTGNHSYEITILSGERGDILVRGGLFRDRTPVQLSGASLAGALLKLRGVYVDDRWRGYAAVLWLAGLASWRPTCVACLRWSRISSAPDWNSR